MKKIDRLTYYINRAVPYAWDDSESWVEFLAKVVKKVNELVELSNDYFDKDLSENVKQILNAWNDSGKLSDIVLSALGDLDARLAENEQEIKKKATQHMVDITEEPYFAIGDETDNTVSIQQAIDDCKTNGGGVVFIPKGTFCHTGLNMASTVTLKGLGERTSVLKNIGYTPSIVINNKENIVIDGLCLLGDLSAPSQHGIEFKGVNPASVVIRNTRIKDHGGHGIYGGHDGHVNNVEITQSAFFNNNHDGINLQYKEGQINAVYIHHNNISWNKKNGVTFFGNNVVVENNTIQANSIYGISVGDEILTKDSYCYGSNIRNNYFELNGQEVNENGSIIGIYSGYENDGLNNNKIIRQLKIENNYFVESGAKYQSLIYLVDLKQSSPSSRHCAVQTFNNYGILPLLTFNKTSALSYGCVIDENYWMLVPLSMRETIPSYVKIRGNYRDLPHNNLTLQNGWSAVVSTKPQYYVDNDIVHLRGGVTGGTGVIATLPSSYRPRYTLTFPVLANNSLGVLNITTNGDIELTAGDNDNVYLDGVSFSIDRTIY